jgi:hypothetical protein
MRHHDKAWSIRVFENVMRAANPIQEPPKGP